jgi:GNAT superfamily N-acetyltransferase
MLSSPFPLINAVIDNVQNGKVLSLPPGEGQDYFVIHKATFSWLSGAVTKEKQEQLPRVIISDENWPPYFHIYDPPASLIKLFAEDKRFDIKNRVRVQLKYQENKIDDQVLAGDYTVQRISKDNIHLLSVFNLEIGTKFWKSESDFLKNGFGFCILTKEGEPVSICYAACLARKTAEIDVATLPSFQQKGFARMVVIAFINYCLSNDITPNWDCFETNYGSLKTAQGLGFKQIAQYPFLSIFNKSKKNES